MGLRWVFEQFGMDRGGEQCGWIWTGVKGKEGEGDWSQGRYHERQGGVYDMNEIQ